MTPAERNQLVALHREAEAIREQAEALKCFADGLAKQFAVMLAVIPAGVPSVLAREDEKEPPPPRHYGSKPLSRTDVEAQPQPTTSA